VEPGTTDRQWQWIRAIAFRRFTSESSCGRCAGIWPFRSATRSRLDAVRPGCRGRSHHPVSLGEATGRQWRSGQTPPRRRGLRGNAMVKLDGIPAAAIWGEEEGRPNRRSLTVVEPVGRLTGMAVAHRRMAGRPTVHARRRPHQARIKAPPRRLSGSQRTKGDRANPVIVTMVRTAPRTRSAS